MPYIKVDMNALSSLSDVLSVCRTRIDEIGDDFSDIAWRLDWDVKSYEVKKKINAVKDAIGDDTKKLKKMYDFLQEAIELYESANIDPEQKEMQEKEKRAKQAKVLNWTVAILSIAATIAVTVATGGAALPVILVSAGTGALTAGVNEWGEQYTEKGADGVDWGEVGESAVIGGVTGAVSGAIGAGGNAVANKVSQSVISSSMTGLQRIGTSAVIGGTSDIVSGALTRGTTEFIKTGDVSEAVDKAFDPGQMVLDGTLGAIGGGVQEYTSVRKAQQAADQAVSDYNLRQKSTPIMDGEKAGLKNLKETPQHSVSFEDSDYILRTDAGEAVQVKIKATGNRVKDYKAAEAAMKAQGVDVDFVSMRTGSDPTHVWHHMDDYNAMTGETTMQFIEIKAHDAIKTHAGSAKQYQVVHGQGYSKKVIDATYEGIDVSTYVDPVRENVSGAMDANKAVDSTDSAGN